MAELFWSGHGSMVTNNVILSYRACGLVTRYIRVYVQMVECHLYLREHFLIKRTKNVRSCEYDRWVVHCGHQTTGLQPNPTQLKPNPTQPNRSSVFPRLCVVGLQPSSNPTRAVAPHPNQTKPQNNPVEAVCGRNLALVGVCSTWLGPKRI